MTGYSIRLFPTSPWGSPWHADTIFGSMAWAWRYLHGVKALEDLLDLYRAGTPPFVLSDAFPGDLLPFPAGALADIQEGEKKKALWISRQVFASFASGDSSKLKIAIDGKKPIAPLTRLHASLGRLTDSTAGGQLFEMDRESLSKDCSARHLTLYFTCEDGWKDLFLQALEAVSWWGFGKKASTGAGAFSVDTQAEKCPLLEPAKNANGFTALGHFLPASGDPVDGAWRLHVKHPKFQSDRVQRFLKGTFILLKPGATFRSNEALKPWYGRVHPLPESEFPKAIQYGLALAAPVRLPQSWRNRNGG